MSRLCVLFDVACVVCGAGACCVDRCADCVPNRVGPSRQFLV